MATALTHGNSASTCSSLVPALALLAASVAAGLAFCYSPSAARNALRSGPTELPVRVERFAYTTAHGKQSYAIVLLPGWYGPSRHPAIPLVITPHGRNTTPESAAKRWFDLPTRGGFAVVLPAGQGRVLQLYSWGYPGQIADLARMPALVEQEVPGFHYLRRRVYAVGTSMGGQEALLLLARHPRLLAGVIAFDPATDLTDRYHRFAEIPYGRQDRQRARIELGGTPRQAPRAYRMRSPIAYVREIACANVPVQLWWSTEDEVIVNQTQQAGRVYRQIKLLNPRAPVSRFVGTWRHAGVSTAATRLPEALARIGLLPASWLGHNPLRVASRRASDGRNAAGLRPAAPRPQRAG